MRTLCLIFPLLSALVCASPAWAQPASLSDAMAAALQHDPQYQAALQRANTKTEQLAVSTSRLRPAIGITSTRLQVDQKVQSGTSPATQQNYPSNIDALVLKQSLYQPQLVAEQDQAQYAMKAAHAQLIAAQQTLALRLASAYATITKENRKSALIARQLELLEQQKTAAEKALQLGTGIAADRDELVAQIALLKVDGLKSSQMNDLARTEFSNITGWPHTQIDALVKSLETKQPAQLAPLAPLEPIASWLDRVQTQNPGLQEALLQVQALQAGLQAVQATRKPTLDLVAQINKSQGENSFFVSSRTHSQSIGLQLYIPITQGGGEGARERAAIAQLKEGQANADQIRSTLISNTQKAYFAIQELNSRALALQKVQYAAEQTALVNKRSHAAGYKTLLDVLAAEQRLLQIQLESLDTQSNLWLAHLQLQAQAASARLD